MQGTTILLLGMASLVASGVVLNRSPHIISGLGLSTVNDIRNGVGDVLTKDELIRQKFILEILHQVKMPLQKLDLIKLDDRIKITNENLYLRPLTQEMLLVLDLMRSNQMLSKEEICSITNKHHLRQIVGLYRLLVTARDFDILKRLMVHARQNVNTEMFVNSLVLALAERDDTKMLIVPALHEILPQLFHGSRIVEELQHLDTGISSLRPNLMDLAGMSRQNRILNTEQIGLLGILNKSHLWMPWRELHRQLAMRKMMRGNVVQQDVQQMDTVVIPLPGQGLLTEDVGLKAYVNTLIDELIVKQDIMRINSNRHQVGVGGMRGQMDMDVSVRGMRNRVTDTDEDNLMTTNPRRGNIWGSDINNDRLLHVDNERHHDVLGERKHGINYDDDMDINMGRNVIVMGGRHSMDIDSDIEINLRRNVGRNLLGSRRLDIDIDTDMVKNMRLGRVALERGDLNLHGGIMGDRGLGNIRNTINDHNMYTTNRRNMDRDRQWSGISGRQDLDEEQRGIHTVSLNDARLLFVGRHHKNPNKVVTLGNTRYDDVDEMSMISGGRRVSSDERKSDKVRKNEKDEYITHNVKKMNKERGTIMNNDYDELVMDHGMNLNRHGIMMHDDDVVIMGHGINPNRNPYVESGKGLGRSRDDFLNIVNRGNIGQRHLMEEDLEMVRNQGIGHSWNANNRGTINGDEPLLYINRHRLDNVVDGRRVGSVGDGDDDEDRYNVVNGRNKIKHSRAVDESANVHSYLDSMDIRRRANVNMINQDLGRDTTIGHRYRRSLLQQNLNHENTINGKLVMHTLQQLVARINVERIALGLPQLIDDQPIQRLAGLQGQTLNQHLTINHNTDSRISPLAITKVLEIVQRIDHVLQQIMQQTSSSSYNQKINQIGLLLAGQTQGIGLVDILGELLEHQVPRRGLVANIIDNKMVQILLAGVVKVVDENVQQIFKTHQEHILTVPDITINNVDVDKLQTYVEQTDIDLTNLMPKHTEPSKQATVNKIVMGRVPRLNHKSFKIHIDVTSEHQQQVVVRNLLVPKVDGLDNTLSLVEMRQNAILLDISTVVLKPGHNIVKLHSKDIALTSPDTTPYTVIYERVMRALDGDMNLATQQITGQTDMLPHRLLIPRGRVDGLPMQLITVITPVQGTVRMLSGNTMNGLDILLLDNLPLNYPLHCDITDLDKISTKNNVLITDVKVYHDNNIKMPRMSLN